MCRPYLRNFHDTFKSAEDAIVLQLLLHQNLKMLAYITQIQSLYPWYKYKYQLKPVNKPCPRSVNSVILLMQYAVF